MINKHIRIATLNARSVFKVDTTPRQKEFASYLSSPSLNIDILCIQELTAFHQQSRLTDEQIQSFQFLYPKANAYLVNKYCGIFCFNPNLRLTNSDYTPTSRFIITTVEDCRTSSTICQIINIYAPANA
jgi:exonuclease III